MLEWLDNKLIKTALYIGIACNAYNAVMAYVFLDKVTAFKIFCIGLIFVFINDFRIDD